MFSLLWKRLQDYWLRFLPLQYVISSVVDGKTSFGSTELFLLILSSFQLLLTDQKKVIPNGCVR